MPEIIYFILRSKYKDKLQTLSNNSGCKINGYFINKEQEPKRSSATNSSWLP